MTEPSERELEDELLRLARSGESGTALQAKGASLRFALRRRQGEREARERAERDRQRERERDRAEQRRELRSMRLPTWMAPELSEGVRLSWFRCDSFDAEATVEDMAAASARWRDERRP